MSLTDGQLEQAWAAMNTGKSIPAFLQEQGWDEPVRDVRIAMRNKYGGPAFQSCVREKIMPAIMSQRISALVTSLEARPFNADALDDLIAAFQDGVVRLTAKRDAL